MFLIIYTIEYKTIPKKNKKKAFTSYSIVIDPMILIFKLINLFSM